MVADLQSVFPPVARIQPKQITTQQFGVNLLLRRGGGKSPDLQSEYILVPKKITKNSLKTTIHGHSFFRHYTKIV